MAKVLCGNKLLRQILISGWFAIAPLLATSFSMARGDNLMAAGDNLVAAGDDLKVVLGVESDCTETGQLKRPESELFQDFSKAIQTVIEICNIQNRSMKSEIGFSCPSTLCVTDYRPGQQDPPKLNINLSWTDNLTNSTVGTSSSTVISSGTLPVSGNISSGVTRSNNSNRGFVIGVSLAITLGKNPDALSCANPMSETMRNDFLRSVLLSSKSPACPRPGGF